MKKAFLLTLLATFLTCLFGCSSSSGCNPREITISFDFGERTGSYNGDFDDNGLPHGIGMFSSQTSTGEKWTYAGNWDHGHWNGQGMTQWEDGRSYCGYQSNDVISGYGVFTNPDGSISVGNFCDDTLNGYGITLTTDGHAIVGNFSNGVPDGYCAIYLTDGSVFWGDYINGEAEGTIYFADGSTVEASYFEDAIHYDPKDLVKPEDQNDSVEETVAESNQESYGFFSDDEIRITYCDMLQECRYSDLYDYLSEAIHVADLEADDKAFDIMEKTARLSELSKKCDVEVDKVEGSTSVFFSGLKDITSKANVIPSLHTTSFLGISSEYKIGFRKNGWLFFDKVTIVDGHGNKHDINFNRLNVNTDVISGSTIQESTYVYDLGSDIIVNHENDITIRFYNSNTREYIDHELTDLEVSAIETLSEIEDLHSSIYLELKD